MPAALAALIYAAALCGLYARALDAPYWHDDFIWLYWGRHLGSPSDLVTPHHFTYFVRPVTMAWFVATAPLTWLHPWAARLASIALVTASALLLDRLVLRLSRRPAAAFSAGLLFVASAHHWELVCGAAAVGDVLVGLFTTAALLLHLDEERRPWRTWTAAGMAALAMLSKESGLIVPVLVTLEDALLCRDDGRTTRLLPVWGAAVASFGLELTWVGGGRGVPALPTASTFALDAPRMVLSTFVASPAPLSAAAGAAALAALCGGLALAWRRVPGLALLLVWVMVGWLPYLLLAPAQLDQDRYGYLASFGAAGAMGWALGALFTRSRMAALLALAALVGWNVAWQQRYTTAIVEWLRPREALREQVEDIARRLPPSAPVYVYAHPETWHEPGYALALYADLPPARVHDWYEALGAPTGAMIHWDEEEHAFHDLTREVTVHEAPLVAAARSTGAPHADPEASPVPTTAPEWDFTNAAGRSGWSGVRGANASTLPRFETDGHALLAGPPMHVDPWGLWSIEVEYEVEAMEPGASMRVAWASERDPSGDWRHVASVGLHPGRGLARFFPSTRAVYWTEGALTRLHLQPSDRPARLRVLGVYLRPVPPPQTRRRF